MAWQGKCLISKRHRYYYSSRDIGDDCPYGGQECQTKHRKPLPLMCYNIDEDAKDQGDTLYGDELTHLQDD